MSTVKYPPPSCLTKAYPLTCFAPSRHPIPHDAERSLLVPVHHRVPGAGIWMFVRGRQHMNFRSEILKISDEVTYTLGRSSMVQQASSARGFALRYFHLR